jgi:hypothetical protein
MSADRPQHNPADGMLPYGATETRVAVWVTISVWGLPSNELFVSSVRPDSITLESVNNSYRMPSSHSGTSKLGCARTRKRTVYWPRASSLTPLLVKNCRQL